MMRKCIAILLTCLSGVLFYQALAFQTETKKIKKTFLANEHTELYISNKYGTIDIKDWDKNSVEIEVIIRTDEENEEEARKIVDLINIQITQMENQILAETDFDESLSKILNTFSGSSDKNFEIIYNINAPEYIKLNLSNKYGSIYISTNTAASVIDLQYGKLKINKLISANKNAMSVINLAYSEANIEESAWLKLVMKYSNANITKSKALITISKYSKLFLDYGSSLVTESKYDTYKVGELSNFVGSGGYSNFKIETLKKKLDLETKYTDVTIRSMSENFEEITINNEYGGYNIGINPNASYILNGNAKYAKIEYNNNAKVSRFQEGGSLRIDGFVGEKSEKMANVSIETKYGSVNLNY